MTFRTPRGFLKAGRRLFALLFVCACDAPSLDLPPITFEGKNIRFGTTASEQPCEGTLHTLDRRVGILTELLGVPLPPGKKIHLYWMPGELDRTPCRENMDGCASVRNGEMNAFVNDLNAAEHEAVHLILWPLGIGHKLFVEGLAECYGGLHHTDPVLWPHNEETIQTLFTLPIDNAETYRRAGVFVCYLAERFGIEEVRRLTFLSKPSWSIKEINRGFKTVFSTSLEETIADFSGDVSGCYPIPLRCDMPSLPQIVPTIWEETLTLNCEDDRTEGCGLLPADKGSDIVARLYQSRRIDITTSGYFRICITDSSFPSCIPLPVHAGTPVPPEWTARQYSPVERGFEDSLRTYIETAQCRVGPGCPNAESLFVPVGFEQTVYLDADERRLTVGYIDTSAEILRHKETITVRIEACKGDNRHYPQECIVDATLKCAADQCRVCDTLVAGEPVAPDPKGSSGEPACFHCRCLP